MEDIVNGIKAVLSDTDLTKCNVGCHFTINIEKIILTDKDGTKNIVIEPKEPVESIKLVKAKVIKGSVGFENPKKENEFYELGEIFETEEHIMAKIDPSFIEIL